MNFATFFFILFVTNYVSTESGFTITSCKIDDNVCLKKSMSEIAVHIMPGIPELGVKPLDPLHQEEVEVFLSDVRLKATNYTITGYKECKIKDMKFSAETSKVRTELHCPDLDIQSKYEISGLLIVLQLNGSGELSLSTGRHQVTLDADIEKIQGADGKTHLQFDNIKAKNVPVGPVKYNFKNLYNNDDLVTQAANTYINDNWKQITLLLQDPAWDHIYKGIFATVNKYLITVPYEDIIKD